jgi:hypothetical protein
MANKIIHKHSSVITENGKAKLPSAEQLEYGEVAVNYADGVETISFKNSNNEIVEFKSAHYFEQIILEDEAVTAAALTNLDTRLGAIESGEPIIDIITAETAEMKDDIQELSDKVTAIASDMENNELVVATALTDLNDRVLEIENKPEIVVTSSKIKDTVQNASGITADASSVVQAKAVYEYTASRTEIEDMEYVLVLAITNLEARVKELEAQLTNVNTALDNIIES